ncbi:MAG TPA: hypothetical protein VK361_06725 [Rubrobacteraceae bacterium]|nr:hypothetical protein [Rubrobacteraceae bacterium]
MAEHGDEPLIDDLKTVLDAYEEARKGWREVAILLKQERVMSELEDMTLDPNDERQLYQFARNWADITYIGGEVPEHIFAQVARDYMLTVDRLPNLLDNLSQHLKEISGGPHEGS